MAEIDISGQLAKEAEKFSDERFDYVIYLLGKLQKLCLFGKASSYCGRGGVNCPTWKPGTAAAQFSGPGPGEKRRGNRDGGVPTGPGADQN